MKVTSLRNGQAVSRVEERGVVPAVLWSHLPEVQRQRPLRQQVSGLPADTACCPSLHSIHRVAVTEHHYFHEPGRVDAGCLCHIQTVGPAITLVG